MCVQFNPQGVNGLDGRDFNVLVMHIAFPEILQIRIANACIALEEEYVLPQRYA